MILNNIHIPNILLNFDKIDQCSVKLISCLDNYQIMQNQAQLHLIGKVNLPMTFRATEAKTDFDPTKTNQPKPRDVPTKRKQDLQPPMA